MPQYKFGDAENYTYQIPKGDYPFEVLDVEFGVQRGGKTNGSDTADLKVAFYDKDGKKLAQWNELLIFHESCFWRIDTFVKSSNYLINGRPPREGEEISFERDDLIGLRGWCSVADNEYETKSGEKRVNSRVAAWLTDRAMLPKKQKAVSLPPGWED